MVGQADLLPVLSRFLEAVSVAHKWRRLRTLEVAVTQAVAKIFRKQSRAALKGLAFRRYTFNESWRIREALTLSDGEALAEEASAETREEFFETIQEASSQALALGWAEAAGTVGYSIAFDLRNPRAVNYLQEHGYGLISQIDAVTRGNIATIVGNGVNEGWSYNRVAREIISLYSEMAEGRPQAHIDSRAHLIAITEMGNAYEAGSAMVIRDMEENGAQMEKKWLTVGSGVIDACGTNEAQGWIPNSQAFSSGHQHPLMHPACRCTTLYRRKEGT
jgi:hypothetical protein